MLQTETRSVDGRSVRFARVGDGPPLVLTHGYPENLHLFGRLARELADSFEVVAVDWPGLGASDRWPGGAGPTEMAARLRDLLDLWGFESAHLLGLDMGGQPVLVAAARWPERVDGAVVTNSLAFGDGPTSTEIRLLRRLGINRLALERFPRVVFARALRTFLPADTRLDRALRREFWRQFRRPEVREYLTEMSAAYERALGGLPREYARVEAPVLALWGQRDAHFPPEQGRRLADRVPDGTFRLVPEGHHWMVWNRAREVARVLDEWIPG